MTAVWKGAWWRKIVKTVSFSAAERSCRRLTRGHRMLRKRSWDERIQQMGETCVGTEVPWHKIAQDLEAWQIMKLDSI